MIPHLAFDCAKLRTGWAYPTAPGVWATGVVHDCDLWELQRVARQAHEAGVRHAVLEDCYLRANVATLKALQRAQTMCGAACLFTGLIIGEPVMAVTWQTGLGLRKGDKAGAMLFAQRLGYRGRQQDEADAVCLAYYAGCQARQAELVASARGGTGKGNRS